MRNRLYVIMRIFILISVLVIFLLIGYIIEKNIYYTSEKNNKKNFIQDNINYEEKSRNRTIDNVTMIVKKETITKTGATFIIIDKNETPYSYGEWYMIEKKENNRWNGIMGIVEGHVWPLIAQLVGEDRKLECKINWSELYGELEVGEYRLVKEVSNQHIYAEFNIE